MSSEIILQGESVAPGESKIIELNVTKSWTHNQMKIPVIINRAKEEGPCLLLTGGVHGDEISGVAVVRDIIRGGYNIPDRGSIICIPIINIFGFLNQSRDLPDGRDLNRKMPGSEKGSLTSQLAYIYSSQIAPLADYVIDFHAGGREIVNYPNIRLDFEQKESLKLAEAFASPYIVNSPTIPNSIRAYYDSIGVASILYEGGKSLELDPFVIKNGVAGARRVMKYLGIGQSEVPDQESIKLKDSYWIRSNHSGMYQVVVENGNKVKKGKKMGVLTDPYGEFQEEVRAPYDLYLFGVNTSPLIYDGDALFHVTPI